jgi:hypothetical protein
MARQFLLYLYSRANIVGSIFALIGILLASSGIAGGLLAIPLVIGLYLLGAFIGGQLFREGSKILEKPDEEKTLEEMKAELERLVVRSKRNLPVELSEKVESIYDSIVGILPTLAKYEPGDYNLYNIRQTALDYLPEAIENYLSLPPAYANSQPVQNGKTPRKLLLEQLTLLDEEMKEIVEDISHNDTQKLIVHGRFLADKFKKEELLVRR